MSEEIRALDRYSRFVAKLHDSPVFNPDEHALVKVARFYRSAREAGRSDALVHLRGVRRRRSKAAPTINRRMTESDKAAMRAKHLSPAEMIETVEHGARSPRDKMLLLLLGYAGLRISEPLHLYVNDVVELFRETGASKIRLEHPRMGVACRRLQRIGLASSQGCTSASREANWEGDIVSLQGGREWF
ncbi:hypothetical protein [Stenotrophomonas maltophilia]|uniref:hypothetical protein n=1 Tax=Stenotrophomonas maltophilia TaxID=40324 RepID=UPI001F21EE1D|nr:hypothetical protein [Stenotrophomonas maltophilia]MCF3488209.1 hypothetical protein [Stenotrophomonas maltophilia]